MRRTEFAIRATLGATRSRLIRQVITESMLLGLMGGALGVIVAVATVQLVEPQMPTDGIFQQVLSLNISTVLISIVVVGTATVGFSVIPAILVSRVDFTNLIRSDAHSNAAQKQKSTGRKMFVVTQVTLTFLLLIGAGLLLRSLVNLTQVDVGFDTNNILTARFELSESKYQDISVRKSFQSELIQRLEALPGVDSASVVTFAPLTYSGGSGPYRIEGHVEESS